MSDMDFKKSEPQEEGQEHSSYAPASFEKRTAAWMGIAYALMFCFVITFSMYRPNSSLAGSFPLFLVPVAVAAAVVTIYRQAKGTAPGGLALSIVIVTICIVAAVIGLWLGVPVLAQAFAG